MSRKEEERRKVSEFCPAVCRAGLYTSEMFSVFLPGEPVILPGTFSFPWSSCLAGATVCKVDLASSNWLT